ncbi:hypothetical protein CDV31_001082 [Fusarium ambrosium]|uniref:N-acetyltransferase domain-containing protein n=1 Tax=Fusarium ambrosium TaxID=131363 RepID=A0A428V0C6_9HYPO|nr:hypothetical protein CDV31_001082 [Fusarium ambrosium]
MSIEIVVPSENDAPSMASVHLDAMDPNLLMHAQFPNIESLDFLRGWLCRETMDHVRSENKGVLIARDTDTGSILSFVKWAIHGLRQTRSDHEDEFPACCRREYLDSYAALTKEARVKVLGDKPHYHVSYLCTDPKFGGRGAASGLLRRVQAEAAAENAAVILEATMNAVTFYEKLGFKVQEKLEMTLPARGSSEPTELYEERTMVWAP